MSIATSVPCFLYLFFLFQADNTGSGPGAGPAAFGEKALLQHLLQTNGPVPAHPRPKKGQNKHSVETDIQEALRAAKGTEQINQAIQSIEGPCTFSIGYYFFLL